MDLPFGIGQGHLAKCRRRKTALRIPHIKDFSHELQEIAVALKPEVLLKLNVPSLPVIRLRNTRSHIAVAGFIDGFFVAHIRFPF